MAIRDRVLTQAPLRQMQSEDVDASNEWDDPPFSTATDSKVCTG